MAGLNLTAMLHLSTAGFTNSLRNAEAQVNTFTSKLGSKLAVAHKRTESFGAGLADNYKNANKELRTHTLGLKDTARIIQGIVISQAFYSIAGSIRDATRALTSFNEQLDYAQVTFGALFGDANMSTELLESLKSMSVDTIFDYETLAGATKKLLAYGIEAENVLYTMQGLINFGSMSGDTAALDRIALALGQIKTTGYLTATEMRQLANAYVPIYDIIQKSFNLTGKQMQNVGDLRLPAHEVLNAIVDYSEAKFGDVADAAMLTITGLKNRVVDTMKVTGSEMMQPLTTAWKSFLLYVSKGLESMRTQYRARGAAGIFESLVPDEAAQMRIRTFLANLANLAKTVMSVFAAIGAVLKPALSGLGAMFSVLVPPIMLVVNVLSGLIKAFAESSGGALILRTAAVIAAGAFVVLKAKALGALVITAVTKAVAGLSKALLVLSTLITKHPILMLIAALAISVAGVAAASNNADNSLQGLFKTINGMGGTTSPEDIFKETTGAANDAAGAMDKFNNAFGAGAEEAENLKDGLDSAGKAAKKAKGLLSFDEVFKLNDSSAGGASGTPSYDPSAIGELINGMGGLGASLIPEIPDFTEFIDGFTEDLFGGLMEKIKSIASGGMTGALVGGLAGFAIGGLITKTLAGALTGAKWGAKLGGLAGAGFAAFWEDTYKEFEAKLMDIAAGAGSGALIGGLAGFVIGAFVTRTMAGAMSGAKLGTTIGAVIGGTVGTIFDGASEAIADRIKQIAFGSAEGALYGGLAGMILGAFATKTMEGAMTGARIGSALGMVIGGTVGGIFGDAETTVAEYLENLFSGATAAGYGMLIGGLVGMIVGAIVGAMAGAGVGAVPGAKAGASLGAAVGGLGGLLIEYLDNSGIAEGIGNWFSNLWSSVGEWFSGLGERLSSWWTNTKQQWSDGWENLKTKASNWWTDTKESWSTGWENLKTNASTKWSEIKTGAATWLDGMLQKHGTSLEEVKQTWLYKWGETQVGAAKTWLEMRGDGLKFLGALVTGNEEKLNEIKTKWSDKWETVKTNVSTKWNEIKTTASDWWTNLKQDTVDGLDSIKTWWSDKWETVKTTVSAKWDEIKTTAATWLDGILQKNGTSLEEVKNNWSEKWNTVKTNVGKKWDEIKTDAGAFLSALLSGNTTKLEELKNKWVEKWQNIKSAASTKWGEIKSGAATWLDNILSQNGTSLDEVKTKWSTKWGEIKTNLSTWFTTLTSSIKTWWSNLFNTKSWTSGWTHVKQWFSDLWGSISNWFSNLSTSVGNWWTNLWKGKEATVSGDVSGSLKLSGTQGKYGHAKGGIFNREHIARFAEGDKAEAIIPLENASAMQPFVDAVSQGLIQGLAPTLLQLNGNSNNSLPPMYVGTLVADDRGLKQLYKKFEVIKVQEDARRGILHN